MRSRTGNACLAVAGLLIVLGGIPPPALTQERPLEGRVIDARGAGVSDATIFLTPVGRPRYATVTEAGARPATAAGDGAGRVEGRLAPVLDEAPLQSLKAGEARYFLTSLRALFEPTDTELRIDYRSVLREARADPAGGAARLLIAAWTCRSSRTFRGWPSPMLAGRS